MTSNKSRSRFYDPNQRPAKVNFIICVVFVGLFCGAAWYSLTSTLDQQQRTHCEQGWQPACEALK